MLNRNAVLFAAGAALLTLDVSIAAAQARSTRRIPISKEGPATTPTARVDTVTVYKTDTLRTMGTVDTLRVAGPTVTTVVHDTVVQQVQMTARRVGGVYLGLGAGPNLPFGAIRTVNEPGVVGQVNLGWQGLNSPIGVRVDGTWTQFAQNADYALLGDRPMVMNGNADLRLNLPVFNNFLGSSVRMTPYVIGGGSYMRYKNLRMKLDADQGVSGGYGPQHAVIAGNLSNSTTAGNLTDTDWHDDWGWNAGGGLAFHAGKKEVFVEARGIHFNRDTNRFSSSWSVPIIFGINFF
jgi:hypothetical protein